MIVELMADQLGLPPIYIVNLSRAASYEYKMYSISKRTGGYRLIAHPSRRLKALQRWLLLGVIDSLPVHQCATAYRKGKSIFDNARDHASSRYLLRMDLQNFFPSISEADVRQYIAQHAVLFEGWTVLDFEVFCGLVCRNKALTIGAPTSPALSNALCYDLDVTLHAMSDTRGVLYTRYADDLFFSTTPPFVLAQVEKDVITAIANSKLPAKLTINASKTRHSSKRRIRHVTGIVLGSDGKPHIGRKVKRRIRALIHDYAGLSPNDRASLAGLIAYAKGFDPAFINNLIAKYGLPRVQTAMAPKLSS